MTFKDLGIIEPILKALEAQGYEKPTEIQEQAIPILLKGKDLLGCAQTGTGKTAAFTVPIIQHLYERLPKGKRKRLIRALIVTPTRELAIQIGENITAYAKFTHIRNTVIFGGVKQGAQTHALQKGVDILVATPGRLLDLIGQGFVSLADIEFFVLDEADRMLDMGFIHDIRRIIRELPEERQSLFFSATMAPSIVQLSRKILGTPRKVTVRPEQTTAERVEQAVYFVAKRRKSKLLIHLLQTEDMDSTLVFSRTKHGANRIVKLLNKAGIHADAIHGNKTQGARQRALGDFKSGRTSVLVATDIAARGIDVEDLSHVVNYDLPNVPETYVHRIGRTGRAGASGIALSFCDVEERPYLKDIQRLIDKRIPVVGKHPYVQTADGETVGEEPVAKQKDAPKAKSQGRKEKPKSRNSRQNSKEESAAKKRTSQPKSRSAQEETKDAPEAKNRETRDDSGSERREKSRSRGRGGSGRSNPRGRSRQQEKKSQRQQGEGRDQERESSGRGRRRGSSGSNERTSNRRSSSRNSGGEVRGRGRGRNEGGGRNENQDRRQSRDSESQRSENVSRRKSESLHRRMSSKYDADAGPDIEPRREKREDSRRGDPRKRKGKGKGHENTRGKNPKGKGRKKKDSKPAEKPDKKSKKFKWAFWKKD